MKKWTLLLCAIACLSSINTATAKVLTLEEVDNGQLHDGLVPYTSWPFFCVRGRASGAIKVWPPVHLKTDSPTAPLLHGLALTSICAQLIGPANSLPPKSDILC